MAEFQARGVIHLHVPIRLDGPDGPDGPGPQVPVTTALLEGAIGHAAAAVTLDTVPLADGTRCSEAGSKQPISEGPRT